jgi:LysM repeat protein
MERLGVVAVLAGRGWRAYAGPVAFLLAATVAVGLFRGHLVGRPSASSSTKQLRTHSASAAPKPVAPKPPAPKLYVVRAGDTIEAIASRTGTTTGAIMRLNPSVTPTALFIGEKLKLR